MKHRICLSSAAQRDLVKIAAWYEEQKTGLSRDWFRCLDEATDRAAESPLSCSPIEYGLRKVRLERFPHTVIFRLWNKQIRVVAIVGDGQDWDRVLTDRIS